VLYISEVSGVGCQVSAQPLAQKTAGQNGKETLVMAVVGSTTAPTGIGGHGGPPYFTKIASNFMKFHISVASGRGRPVKSNEKLMNVEHRTSNIEHRIMHSVYLNKD
jgi:hypothetical protein